MLLGEGQCYFLPSNSGLMKSTATKPTVFVVDDEPMLLELAAVIIAPLGCEVRTFRDPETALREFAIARPDLVLTDSSGLRN